MYYEGMGYGGEFGEKKKGDELAWISGEVFSYKPSGLIGDTSPFNGRCWPVVAFESTEVHRIIDNPNPSHGVPQFIDLYRHVKTTPGLAHVDGRHASGM